ncbi:MAG TPA: hydrogenase maturation nickel metallochaperone HypA [Gammaproteobacteria bacterium]|nr:hydrogenase maturation nickel metallochaperone HypA [Gammaproteobacteria bacterium]
MHELSLCKNMVAIILNHAEQLAGKSIKIIHIEIGELIAVESATFLFNFNVIKKATILEKSQLNMITILGQAFCETCQQVIRISSYYQPCTLCGNFSLKIIAGQELRVKSMEVE